MTKTLSEQFALSQEIHPLIVMMSGFMAGTVALIDAIKAAGVDNRTLISTHLFLAKTMEIYAHEMRELAMNIEGYDDVVKEAKTLLKGES